MILEFETVPELLEAARRHRVIDAYTPFPVKELDELVPARPDRVTRATFLAGLTGAVTGFGLQTFSAVWHYPFRVGGTPSFAWPAFLAVTFELGVLFAAFAAFFSALLGCGLPRLYHPIFEHPGFSTERFYLEVDEPCAP